MTTMTTFLEKNIFHTKYYLNTVEEVSFFKFSGKKSSWSSYQSKDFSNQKVRHDDLPVIRSSSKPSLSQFLNANLKPKAPLPWLANFISGQNTIRFWWTYIDEAMALIQATASVLARFRISPKESQEKVLLLLAAGLYSEIINFDNYTHETEH